MGNNKTFIKGLHLNPFKRMNTKELIVFTILQLASFVVIYILSRTIFLNIYVLRWTAHNYYLYIWMPVIILSLCERTIISLFITIGNIIGNILGQLLGDLMQYINMQKITDTMTEEQKYMLMSHKGVYIWMLMIIIFMILGVIVNLINKRERSKKMN